VHGSITVFSVFFKGLQVLITLNDASGAVEDQCICKLTMIVDHMHYNLTIHACDLDFVRFIKLK